MRARVYVDAFNLYYRRLKRTEFKWLDLGRMCRLLLPDYDIRLVRYFTAIVDSRPDDPDEQQRQQAYLRALNTDPHLEIHYGSFMTNKVFLPLADPPEDGSKYVRVVRTEEKGSDVNLATWLLVDGFQDEYDTAWVMSNDSDLLDPIRVVREELGKRCGVIITDPNAKRSSLKADTYRQIRDGVLRSSQFADVLHDADGEIHRPTTWEAP